MKDAAQRCVAITLVTNGPETNDLPEIGMEGRGHYEDLLVVNKSPEIAACPNTGAGLRIWEWIGHAPGDPVQQGTIHPQVRHRRSSRRPGGPLISTLAVSP